MMTGCPLNYLSEAAARNISLSLFLSPFPTKKSDTTATVPQRRDVARCCGLILQKGQAIKYSLAAASFHIRSRSPSRGASQDIARHLYPAF